MRLGQWWVLGLACVVACVGCGPGPGGGGDELGVVDSAIYDLAASGALDSSARCAPRTADCNGDPHDGCEIHIDVDPRNCGGCGRACAAPPHARPACVAGACAGDCEWGFADCNGNLADGCEIDLSSDVQNCDACGAICPPVVHGTPACHGSECVIAACDALYGDCNQDLADGCELSLAGDMSNCGACGNTCRYDNAQAACVNGQCNLVACNPGFYDCDGAPANGCEANLNLDADPNNCGACGKVCIPPPHTVATCAMRRCGVGGCVHGFGDCNNDPRDGCEIALDTDVHNCGACGLACVLPDASALCVGGACAVSACKMGFGDCNRLGADGCEAQLATDPANCGACATVCPSRLHRIASCGMSQCGLAGCVKGFADCNNNLADGCEVNSRNDPANCGGCGTVCPAHQVCNRGICEVCGGGGTLDFLSSAAPGYPAGAGPVAVGAGDLDGDGNVDLAIANQAGGNVSVLVGNGDGTFRAAVNYDAGRSPNFVAIGDLNGDGKPDLAIAGVDNVSVLLGDGKGKFGPPGKYRTGIAVAISDLNGDRRADLVIADSDGVSVLLGNGDGTFQAPVTNGTGDQAASVAIGDLNADGKPDVVTAGWRGGGSTSVLLGKGDGTFHDAVNYKVPGSSVALEDLDGDGKLDIAAGGYRGVSVLLGSGNGTFQAEVDLPVDWEHIGPDYTQGATAIADLNGDGKPDIALVSTGASVFLGNGDGTFQAEAYYDAGNTPQSVATADLDRDGKPDLAITNDKGVSVLRGKGRGTFEAALAYAPVATSVTTGDLNGDGQADLVVTGAPTLSGATVSILLGNGDGTFQAAAHYRAGSNANWSVIADLNGDGKQDVAVANAGRPGAADVGDVTVLLGNGDGTLRAAVHYKVGHYPTSIVAGDFNADGKMDLAVASTGTTHDWGGVYVLLGHGDGTFEAPGAARPPQNAFLWEYPKPASLAIGDLNADGKPDLVVGDIGDVNLLTNPQYLFFLGNGDGTFSGVGNYQPNRPDLPRPIGEYDAWTGRWPAAIGDLNGDGNADLALGDRAGKVAVLLGNGDGTFQDAVEFDSGVFPGSVAIGDLNADGKADIAVAWGSVSILLGHGDGTFQAPSDFRSASAWSVAIGEVSGDCLPDIVTVGLGGASVLLNTTH